MPEHLTSSPVACAWELHEASLPAVMTEHDEMVLPAPEVGAGGRGGAAHCLLRQWLSGLHRSAARIFLAPRGRLGKSYRVRSAVIGLLLVLALLPATLRAAQPQAWAQDSRSRPWLARVEIEQRILRERVERAPRNAVALRERTEKRSPGAGPPPAGGGHAHLAVAFKSLRRSVAYRPLLQHSLPPPEPVRDQRVSIRRSRASAHVPHVGDDDPAADRKSQQAR